MTHRTDVEDRLFPRRSERLAPWTAAVVVAGLLAARAPADGTIDTTGATLTTGAAATPGQVVVDPAAPAAKVPAVPRLEPVGTIGGFSVAMPPAPRPFHGGEAFVASASMALAGGVHEYASYSVPAGASVAYDGPATIRVAGDVSILGAVATTVGRPGTFKFESGGRVTLGPSASVSAGPFQDVAFDSGGPFDASAGPEISAQTGTATIRTRRTAGAASDIRIDGVRFATSGVMIQASGGVEISGGGTIQMTSGDVVLQAFGGDVKLTGGSQILMTAGTPGVRLEAAGSISITGADSGVRATSAAIQMRAFGGGLSITDGGFIALNGSGIDLAASGAVVLGPNAATGLTVGPVRLRSSGGDVTVHAGVIYSNTAEIELAAARDVVIEGTGAAVSTFGSVRVAAGRDVVNVDPTFWFSDGGLVVLARRSIVAPHLSVLSPSATFVAETGAIGLADLSYQRRHGAGGFRAVASAGLAVGGSIDTFGPIELVSRTADVDVSGCVIATATPFPVEPTSSPVSIESFGGAAGRIVAVGAKISTGAVPDASGDVRLVVHVGEIVDPVEGFLVPTRVSVSRLRTGGTVLAATGVLDAGATSLVLDDPDDPNPALDAVLTVGDVSLPVSLARAGRNRLRAVGDGYRLDLAFGGADDRRAAFQLRRVGDFSGFLSSDGSGELTLRIAFGARVSSASVRLKKGAYPAVGVPRAVRLPDLYVARLEGRMPGARPGTLDATFGVGDVADAVAAASDVTIAVGSRFSATVPMSAFVQRPAGLFRADRPTPGVRLVVIDLRSGTLRIVASDADLRTSADEVPMRLAVGVSFGAQQRRVLVRVRGSGTRIVY